MTIVKVVELIGGSEKGFDDAVANILKEASKTIKNIKSIYVKDMKAEVRDNKIISYGVIAKVSFEVERE